MKIIVWMMKTSCWNAFWWCHLFPGTLTFNMYRSDISVKFHFTDLAPCRPSRAAGPSKLVSRHEFGDLQCQMLFANL